jgi:hypothetical protein
MGGAIVKLVSKKGSDKIDLTKYESLNEIPVSTL